MQMERSICLKLLEFMEETVNPKYMDGSTALLPSPPSEDFREAMKRLVFSLLMKEQSSLRGIAHVGTACVKNIGNIWTIHEGTVRNSASNGAGYGKITRPIL